MRYDQRLSLYSLGPVQYNPSTSQQERTETALGVFPCHLSSPGVETQQAVFGSVTSQDMIARFPRPLQVIADGVRHGEQKYQVVRATHYRHDSVLYLKAVTAWT